MRLTGDDCARRLTGARSAVLAVNDAAGPPLAVPITYAVLHPAEPHPAGCGTHGGRPAGEQPPVPHSAGLLLGFAVDHKPKSTTRLRRLRLIGTDPRVAVLADGYDEDWHRLWWVRADGEAEILTGDAPLRDALVAALADRYPQYRDHPPDGVVVAVRIHRLTGWSGAS